LILKNNCFADTSSLFKKGINHFIVAFSRINMLSLHINTAAGSFGSYTCRRDHSLDNGQRVCTSSTVKTVRVRTVHSGPYSFTADMPSYTQENGPLRCVFQGLQLHQPETVLFSTQVRRWRTTKARDSYLPTLLALLNDYTLPSLKNVTVTLGYPPDGCGKEHLCE
jgi:hypothetical protein